jgi:hypothetical protein
MIPPNVEAKKVDFILDRSQIVVNRDEREGGRTIQGGQVTGIKHT